MRPWYLTRIRPGHDNRARYLLFPSRGLNRSTKHEYLKPNLVPSIHTRIDFAASPQCDIIQIHNEWKNGWMHDWYYRTMIESFTHCLYRPYQHFRFFFCPLIPLRMPAMPAPETTASISLLLSGTISRTYMNYNYVLRIKHLGRSPAQTNPGNRRSICW